MTPSPGEALVARLLAVIGGDAPMAEAARLLAPDVICHMDRFTVRGTAVWADWVEFLRSRAGAGGALRAEVDRLVTRPDGTIVAFGRLCAARAADAPHAPGGAPPEHRAIYRVADGRIAEIWTTRANYEMIFGARARHPLTWLLVLAEMAVWRRLPWRGSRRASPNTEELGDRRRDEPRRGSQADVHPERRRPHRERGGARGA